MSGKPKHHLSANAKDASGWTESLTALKSSDRATDLLSEDPSNKGIATASVQVCGIRCAWTVRQLVLRGDRNARVIVFGSMLYSPVSSCSSNPICGCMQGLRIVGERFVITNQ